MIKHSIMLREREKIPDSMRLDKWLWCARFYKTRKLALEAIKSGRIKHLGKRVKPSRSVKCGEDYVIKRGPYTQEITVLAMSRSRRSPADAVQLYRESEDSIQQRDNLLQQLKINNAMAPRSHGRPSKRDRRKLIDFTRHGREE